VRKAAWCAHSQHNKTNPPDVPHAVYANSCQTLSYSHSQFKKGRSGQHVPCSTLNEPIVWAAESTAVPGIALKSEESERSKQNKQREMDASECIECVKRVGEGPCHSSCLAHTRTEIET